MSAILMRYSLRLEPHVVADADLGHDDADFGGDALPHALDALEQIAAALGVGQADEADADFDLHRIDGEVVFDPLLGGGFFACSALVGGLLACALRFCVSMRAMPKHAAPSTISGMRGRSVVTRIARNPPVTASACGREKSCVTNCCGRFVFCVLRVTSKPAASEMRNAGTWLTRPSPIVSRVKTPAASPSGMPCSTTPMTRPPMMLMSVMTMPAMASPRTNLLAPSMAP